MKLDLKGDIMIENKYFSPVFTQHKDKKNI